MAITVLSKTPPYPVTGGQVGFYRQDFTCAWSTTDTTGTVPSGLRKVTRPHAPAYLSQPGEGEVMYFASTVNGDGSVTLDSGQVITLGRVSVDPTSGLKFTFSIDGYV